MSAYAEDRVTKIGQIMPQFSDVAEPGDRVYMGLEGDPLFPSNYKDDRPVATIEGVEKQDEEYLVSLRMQDGSVKRVSSMSLSPTDSWEYTDASFERVMEREKVKQEERHRAEATFRGARAENATSEHYRGTSAALGRDIESLQTELQEERNRGQVFRNAIVEAMGALAEDVKKLDRNGKCEFCDTLTAQLETKRAEGALKADPTFRGRADFESDASDDYF